MDDRFGIRIDSTLPWKGEVTISMTSDTTHEKSLHFRVPSWCDSFSLQLNNEPVTVIAPLQSSQQRTASGYDPTRSWYYVIKRSWKSGDVIHIEFDMEVAVRSTHPSVKATRGKAAITRGPLVYCLESTDNPTVDIHQVALDPNSLQANIKDKPFYGVKMISGWDKDGTALNFIPYYLWGNRDISEMTVYVNLSSG
jgi:DUF1680 family protein